MSSKSMSRGQVRNDQRALVYGEQPSSVKVSKLPEELQVQMGAQRTGDHTSDNAIVGGKRSPWYNPSPIGGGST